MRIFRLKREQLRKSGPSISLTMNLQDVRAIRTVLADCFPRETVKRENPPDNQSVVNPIISANDPAIRTLLLVKNPRKTYRRKK